MRQERWRSEAEFFDAVAARNEAQLAPVAAETLQRYGAAPLRRRFHREFRFRLLGDLRDQRVLDVGCGEGQDAVILAKLGAAQVTALDVSPKAVEVARKRALINGVADRVDVRCAPIEVAELPPNSFDVVWCSAFLHHVVADLDAVMKNLVLWAKPGAMINLFEPVSFSPTLRRIRQCFPHDEEETPDERPLEEADCAVIRRYIPDLEIRHFSLFERLNRWVLSCNNYERSSWPRRATANLLVSLDYTLLSLPGMGRAGSLAVLWGHPDKSRTRSEPTTILA